MSLQLKNPPRLDGLNKYHRADLPEGAPLYDKEESKALVLREGPRKGEIRDQFTRVTIIAPWKMHRPAKKDSPPTTLRVKKALAADLVATKIATLTK